ncbi:MAG TPA: M20/M25/M40 family metallo-hydrolase [Thermoanaerobaculia bacterium]|nr:M20/M25/M40 family metallo-hydrolase [Thermoanaerobaculia bacterium]
MRSRLAASLLAFGLSTSALAAPPDDAARLAGRAVGDTPLIADTKELCDTIGGRPVGSAANARAVSWAAAKFKAAGADAVRTEAFPVPFLWLPGTAELSIVAPENVPLRVVACPAAPSTPGAITAKVVDAGEGTDADYARLGAKAKGAIAVVRSKEMKTADDLFGEYMRNGPLFDAAKKAGAVAVLLQSTRPRGLLYRHPVGLGRDLAPLPAAMVSREHAARLLRLAEQGDVTVRLNVSNKTGPTYDAQNVVAEIKGMEKPDEVVLLGAHLDSWDLGTGANDNGVNVALLVDALRGIKELGLKPRRTIRFVAFNAEELGMWGSAEYVRAHAKEMGDIAAVVIFDVGSGRTTNFYLNGREDLRKPADAALAGVAGLVGVPHTLEGVDGTDNFDFLLSGVPNLVANQDWAPYLPDYHAESDTFDMVDAREARANVAIASALVWGLANSDARAPRQSRAEVDKLLKETKLDEQMKAMGQWEDWIAGKRGVSK